MLLHLPSEVGLALYNDFDDVFSYSREVYYMNIQTADRNNILNGVHGYFPKSRLLLQEVVAKLPHPESLRELRNDYGAQYLVFHKNLILHPREERLLEGLRTSRDLTEELETNTVHVWSLNN